MTLPQGADLGTTSDPKALIVGDKAAVAEQATAILDEQRRIDKLLDSLNGLAIDSWQGGIGQLQYGSLKLAEATKLGAYRDVLKETGKRLNDYSDALATAQSRAQDAIDKWNQGERVTKEALAEHNAAVSAHNERVDSHNSRLKAGLPVPAIHFVPPGPFVDPGEALRKEAEDILSDAREALDGAGASACSVPKSSRGTTDAGIFGGGIFDRMLQMHKELEQSLDEALPGELFGAEGEFEGFKVDGDTLQLMNAKGEVFVYKLDKQWSQDVGEIKLGGDGSLELYSASGESVAKLTKDGLVLESNAEINVVKFDQKYSAEHGYLKGEASIYGSAGAYTENSATVTSKGVDLGAEAFAGGKIGGGGDFTVGGIGAALDAEGWAGAGYAADLDIGWDDGRVNLKPTFGVGLGLGGKVSPEIVLDFPEMAETGKEMYENPGEALDKLQVTPDEWIDVAKDREGMLKAIDKMQFSPGEAKETGEKVIDAIGGILH